MFSDRWADLLGRLLADVPPRRRALLVFMALTAGGAYAVGRLSATAFVWGAAALVGLCVASGLWFLAAMMMDGRRTSAPVATSVITTAARGGRLVIGLSVERGSIVYGAVNFGGDPGSVLGEVDLHVETQGQSRWSHPTEVYPQAGRAILAVLNELGERRPDGIAIALPGLVDVHRGELQSSPAQIPPARVAVEVAKVLRDLDRGAAHRHGFDISLDGLTRTLNEQLLLDNDTRCLARYLLHTHPDVRNFASIFVGQGVGSSIVVDGELYYGSHGFAGECGHQVLGLARRIDLTEAAGAPQAHLEAPECSCGRHGAHYEILVNDDGVMNLATATDIELTQRLQSELVRSGPLRSAGLLRCAEHVLCDLDGTSEVELCKRVARGDYRRLMRFFSELEESYAELLTMGIANVVNMLDLDDVYLSGPIIELFDRLPTFRDQIRKQLSRYLLRDDRVSVHIDGSAAQQTWLGAALIFRDPSYFRSAAAVPPRPSPRTRGSELLITGRRG